MKGNSIVAQSTYNCSVLRTCLCSPYCTCNTLRAALGTGRVTLLAPPLSPGLLPPQEAANVYAVIVPSEDPHQSEYAAACYERRQFISRFTARLASAPEAPAACRNARVCTTCGCVAACAGRFPSLHAVTM